MLQLYAVSPLFLRSFVLCCLPIRLFVVCLLCSFLCLAACYPLTCHSRVSSSLQLCVRVKFRLSGLVVGAFTHWVISPALRLLCEVTLICLSIAKFMLGKLKFVTLDGRTEGDSGLRPPLELPLILSF